MKTTQRLPKKIKKVWQLSALLSLVIGLAVWAIIVWAVGHFDWPKWIDHIFLALVLLDFVTELLVIPYRYRFWLYQITPTDVEIESGFFLHKQTAIPISRIQKCYFTGWTFVSVLPFAKCKNRDCSSRA